MREHDRTKPHRVAALLVFALAALLISGGAPGANAETCRPTDAVFYAAVNPGLLATELSKSASACADYYVSIPPLSNGAPRGGPPVTTIHSLGVHFHAMADISLRLWADYAATHGWYAAGVEVRRQMKAAGYKATREDTWAINEVGWPSRTDMAVAVLKDTGTARKDFRDFVSGLDEGDDGLDQAGLDEAGLDEAGLDEAGLVFAANPLQIATNPSEYEATNLSEYEQDLEAWYADAEFWKNMAEHVRFWAQETYADADVWGVADSTLENRTAYLNDYFLHGIRLAQRGDGRTAEARAFLAQAYTPVGNMAFSWPKPDPTIGIGYGRTDIGLPAMLNFVSTQTYALRSASGDRFGFAFHRNATATETLAVEDRVADAIHDSESVPGGACGTSGEWCDSTVADAQFNDAWKTFANTLEGSPVKVQVAPEVSVTYAAVNTRGSTWVEMSPASAVPPPRFQLLAGAVEYDLATTADYTAPIDVCVPYDAQVYDGYEPHLFQLTGAGWSDATTLRHAAAVCGRTTTLGTVLVFAADPTPPVIVPHLDGPLGNNDWYVGDVRVTWTVLEPQSPTSVVTSGCDPTPITRDTSGTTLTCAATSDGGTASESVTVKRDATPPALTCLPSPSSLWPPNGKLIPVAVSVTVADATAGPDGFVLIGTDTSLGNPTSDIVDFDAGTPDVEGLLRARRPGDVSETRVYSLAYAAQDLAGNTENCAATVVVPHDDRN